MRGIVLVINWLILALLWLLSQVAITPAHDLLVQYAKLGTSLPILTDLAIQFRSFSAGIPLIWAIITCFIWRRVRTHEMSKRTELLLLHTSLSLCLGFAVLFFFALAGILPLLKIGAAIT